MNILDLGDAAILGLVVLSGMFFVGAYIASIINGNFDE